MPAERRRQILALLRKCGSVTVEQLQDTFGVSVMTARRDLATLKDSGRLVRTHGGAVLPEFAVADHPFRTRLERDVSAKVRLAEALVASLEPRETVFLDSSSSSYYVVREIARVGLPLTVITNSLPVIALMGEAEATHLELIGLGGAFRKATQSFVDPCTIRAVERFSADRVIFSFRGIAPDGSLTDGDLQEATLKRAMIAHSRTAMLIASAEKFKERGLNIIAPAASVDTAYLADPPKTGVDTLRAAGVRIRQV